MKKKKLNFVLLFATLALFVACGNDNEQHVEPEPQPSLQKYPVKFSVTPFEISTNLLRAMFPGTEKYVLQWGIYDTAPSAIDNPPIFTDLSVSDTHDLSSITIDEELPVGSYMAFIMYAYKGNAAFYPAWNHPTNVNDERNGYGAYLNSFKDDWIYVDEMFGEDIKDIYFKRVMFDITATQGGITQEVELQPKWSVVILDIEDAATVQLPLGTTHISMWTNPTSQGFKVMDETPGVAIGPVEVKLTLEQFRNMKKLSIVTGEVPNTEIFIHFSKKDGIEQITNLGTLLVYSGKIDEGKKITFKGNLGNQSGTETVATGFKLTTKDLIDQDIDIEEPIIQ